MIRVLLVDDQELIRAGLRGILPARFGFEIVGECADGRGVAAEVRRLAPDVVLMDVRMPGVDGVSATAELRRQPDAPPVLVLTTFDDDEILAAALRAGASGFLLKGVPVEDLQRAVRTVAEGGAWLDPAVTGRVLSTYRGARVPDGPDPAAGKRSRSQLQRAFTSGRADRAGTSGTGAGRTGPDQRRDRGGAGARRGYRQDPHRPRLRQAGPA